MPYTPLKAANTSTAEAEPIIRVEGFRAAFSGRVVLDDVNFTVQAGEIVVIAGGSGCGKSTVLKHLIGIHRPAAGRMIVCGENVAEVQGDRRRALLRTIGVSYQGNALFGSMSLRENVELVLAEFSDVSRDARRAIAMSKLRLVGLEHAAHQLPSQISGGMQKRAAIARALAVEPRILFLDEPSAGLDPIMSAELDQLIVDLRRMLGMTFVVVSHELASIFTIADRCIVLDAARRTKVAEGPPAELRDSSDDPFVRQFFNREVTAPAESGTTAP